MDGCVKDGQTQEEDERPFLKAGPKAEDSRTPFRDPVLNFCTASGSTPLQQPKFEGLGNVQVIWFRSRALMMVQHHSKRKVLT